MTNQNKKEEERTKLKLYKPTAYLHSLKPLTTKRMGTDLHFSTKNQDTYGSARGRSSYQPKRKDTLVGQTRLYYSRGQPISDMN